MAKTITAAKLVAYAKGQLGRPYWYGCFGNKSTKNLYNTKKKQYPEYYKWACPADQLNKKVHDCVGLIKGAIWCDGKIDGKPTYASSQDVSANGMLDKCTKKGDISKLPEVPGVLVFMDHHVGIYIGNGEVIEAKGHAYGVVKTKLKGRGWKKYGYCPWVEYPKEKKTDDVPKPKPKPKNDAKSTTGVVHTGSHKNLNVRTSPRIASSNIVDSLANGTKVKILSKTGDWYAISHGGKTRYVYAKYIKK